MVESAGATAVATTAAGAAPAATLVWSDNSDTSTNIANVNWFSDYGVEQLPTTARVFSDN